MGEIINLYNVSMKCELRMHRNASRFLREFYRRKNENYEKYWFLSKKRQQKLEKIEIGNGFFFILMNSCDLLKNIGRIGKAAILTKY